MKSVHACALIGIEIHLAHFETLRNDKVSHQENTIRTSEFESPLDSIMSEFFHLMWLNFCFLLQKKILRK
jgi:hypothetical protein